MHLNCLCFVTFGLYSLDNLLCVDNIVVYLEVNITKTSTLRGRKRKYMVDVHIQPQRQHKIP